MPSDGARCSLWKTLHAWRTAIDRASGSMASIIATSESSTAVLWPQHVKRVSSSTAWRRLRSKPRRRSSNVGGVRPTRTGSPTFCNDVESCRRRVMLQLPEQCGSVAGEERFVWGQWRRRDSGQTDKDLSPLRRGIRIGSRNRHGQVAQRVCGAYTWCISPTVRCISGSRRLTVQADCRFTAPGGTTLSRCG